MIPKILMQISNAMMVMISLYSDNIFFTSQGREIHIAHAIFANTIYTGCALSLICFIATTFFKVKTIGNIFPYDSVLIFIALIGVLVTTIPF